MFQRRLRVFWRVAGNQNLIEGHVIQNTKSSGAQILCKLLGVITKPINQFLHALFSKGF